MELGELIIESNPQLIWKSILKNGIGISGLNIGLTIKRSIDNYYWQDTLWGSIVTGKQIGRAHV